MIREALSGIMPLTDGQWEQFAARLETVACPKGSFLLREGDVCDRIYFVREGTLRTFYVDGKGNEVNFLFHLQRDFFTDYESVLTGKPSVLSIQALQPSSLFAMSKSALDELYASDPAWHVFGRKVAEGIYLLAKRRVEQLLFLTAEERYLHLFRHEPELLRSIPQKHLSSFLGIQPQSLSRIRKRIS